MAYDWSKSTFPLDAFRRDIMVPGLGTVLTASYTGTPASTAAINSQVVMVWASTDCHVVFDDTATTSHTPLTAKTTYFLLVPQEGTSTLSAIRQASSGTLYVTEVL